MRTSLPALASFLLLASCPSARALEFGRLTNPLEGPFDRVQADPVDASEGVAAEEEEAVRVERTPAEEGESVAEVPAELPPRRSPPR